VKAKKNAIAGILHTPTEFKPLINMQKKTLPIKPSAQDTDALRQLAAPLAHAVQKEARSRYAWNRLQEAGKTIFDPNTLLNAMEKDEHWADEDSVYGVNDFLFLCNFFDDNVEDDDSGDSSNIGYDGCDGGDDDDNGVDDNDDNISGKRKGKRKKKKERKEREKKTLRIKGK
jgi:hypothetical protein